MVGAVWIAVGGVVGDAEFGEQSLAQLDEGGVSPTTRRRDCDGFVERDAPVCEHQHAIGEQDCLVDVVGHQQYGGVVHSAQLLQQAGDLYAGGGGGGAGPVVEEQQPG